jgi:orotate phosphoribosyltransferase
MENYQQEFIKLALQYHALTFGEFTLKSGRVSPYFFNMGNFKTGFALSQLGLCYAQAIKLALNSNAIQFDGLFGPAYKGIPLVSTTAIGLYQVAQLDIPYSFNRKEKKQHGEGGHIVGAPLQGRVLMIDDVITAGTAAKEAIELIYAHGAQVAGLVVALDRQERASEHSTHSAIQALEREFNIPVISLVTLNHIIDYVKNEPNFRQYLPAILAYQQQYAV